MSFTGRSCSSCFDKKREEDELIVFELWVRKQAYVVPFYAKLGYESVGPRFDEVRLVGSSCCASGQREVMLIFGLVRLGVDIGGDRAPEDGAHCTALS